MRFAGQLAELLHGAQALVQSGEVQLSVPRWDPADDAVAPGERRGKMGKNLGKWEKMGKTGGKCRKNVEKSKNRSEKKLENWGEMWKKM